MHTQRYNIPKINPAKPYPRPVSFSGLNDNIPIIPNMIERIGKTNIGRKIDTKPKINAEKHIEFFFIN